MRLVGALFCVLFLLAALGCQAEEPIEPRPMAEPIEVEPVEEVGALAPEPTPPAPLEPEPPTPTAAETTYVVQRGDSLWKIAERFYGDGRLWNVIYDANRDRIPSVTAMKPGTKLRIPPRP